MNLTAGSTERFRSRPRELQRSRYARSWRADEERRGANDRRTVRHVWNLEVREKVLPPLGPFNPQRARNAVLHFRPPTPRSPGFTKSRRRGPANWSFYFLINRSIFLLCFVTVAASDRLDSVIKKKRMGTFKEERQAGEHWRTFCSSRALLSLNL